MRHFERNKLSLAIGVAAISLASLPVLAAPSDTHAVNGVGGGSAASYTNGGSVEEVVVLKPMTSVSNTGTVFQNSDTSLAALTINSGANVTTLTNDGTIKNEMLSDAHNIALASYSDLSGTIDNTSNGIISAVVSYDSNVIATALYIDGDITETGSIINAGDIIASASQTSNYYSALAIGVYVSGTMDGSLINDGNMLVTAYNANSYANAQGIHIGGDINGSLENNGLIDLSVTGIDNWATGIYVGGHITATGSILNEGSINIDIDATRWALATGIYVKHDVAGEILNTGDITITDMTGGYIRPYFGIRVDGELTGSLTNDGDMILYAEATHHITGEGIHVGGIGSTGVLTNNGLIDITAVDSDSGGLSATGIHIGGDMDGTLTNDGQIRISATAQGSSGVYGGGIWFWGNSSCAFTCSGVYGGGIWVSGNASGAITNSGEITVTTVSAADAEGFAYGISVDGELTGSITNTSTGQITAQAMNNTNESHAFYATAIGIYAATVGSTGRITNDGTITAKATNTYSQAVAVGIYVGNLNGGIVNNGEIIVEASAYSNVYGATGINVSGFVGVDSYIHNTGTISVEIDDAGRVAYGVGIYVGGDIDGEIINSGDMIAIAMVNDHSIADFHGIDIDGELSGTLTNTSTGTISVSVAAGANATFVNGIDIRTLSGTLNNHGSITVDINGSNYGSALAIRIFDVESIAVINNTGDIIATAGGSHSSGGATAVSVSLFDGTFNNSGTILASDNMSLGTGYDHALYLGSGTGQVNNLTDGLIHGDIHIRGSIAVDNKGTIWLPSAHQGEIFGDYTQAIQGTFRLSALNDTTYGSLEVEGTATFDPDTGIQVVVESGHTLAAGDTLNNVIDAEEGTLNATTFTVGDNNLALNFEAVIDKSTVDLNVTETGFTTGVTAANAFIGSAPTSDLAFALGSMNTLKEVQDASDSLRPALSGGVAQMTNTTTNAVTDIIAARQDRTRGLSSGDGFMEDRHLWVKPFGNWTDQDDRDGVDGYNIDSYGLALGIDGDVSPTWNLGFAFAYIDSDVDSNLSAGSQRIDVDSYMTKVYATKTLDNATALNLQAGFGISDYDSKRRLFNGDVADADYDSWHFQASVELERSYQMNEKTTLTPYVHADYGYVDVDSYREKGASELNLDVNDDSADSLIIGTGVKTSYIASERLLLTADAGIGYDFMTDRSSLTSSFSGGGAQFSTQGIDPDEVVYNAGLGAEYNLDNGSEITVRYEIDGREDYTDQSVSVNFRLLF
jgi:outer membrane autotransporter protein